MRRDFVAVPEHWNVGQLIDFLRGTDELTTDFWEIYVIDPLGKPTGTILSPGCCGRRAASASSI
jgi:magnesium transporter